jgi:hypothetical protein
MEQFYQYAEKPIQTVLKLQRNKYTLETIIDSPQIRAILRQFVLEVFPVVKQEVSSLDVFIKTLPDDYQKAWEQLLLHEPENPLLKSG